VRKYWVCEMVPSIVLNAVSNKMNNESCVCMKLPFSNSCSVEGTRHALSCIRVLKPMEGHRVLAFFALTIGTKLYLLIVL
jgi:hypothetical protein